MRPVTLAIAAACLLAGVVACDPVATSPTQKSTAAAVPAGSAPAAGGDAAKPAAPAGDGDKAQDAAITKCEVDKTLGWPSAEVTITNHSSKSSNYMVQVEFLDASGTRISEGIAATNGLAPGQKSIQKAQGTAEGKGKLSCKVIDVTRYAAP